MRPNVVRTNKVNWIILSSGGSFYTSTRYLDDSCPNTIQHDDSAWWLIINELRAREFELKSPMVPNDWLGMRRHWRTGYLLGSGVSKSVLSVCALFLLCNNLLSWFFRWQIFSLNGTNSKQATVSQLFVFWRIRIYRIY